MSMLSPTSVYFVGIGGIGMSALARYYNARGVKVAGYDKYESALTKKLVEEGIDVHYLDNPDAIPQEVDLAVYTPAVPAELGELAELQKRGCHLAKRAEALGIISNSHKCLAVAGTHGKTTTSTMAAYLMKELNTDAVAFLGGISANYGTNYLAGNGDWMVVEADEYDRSFLHLKPDIAVVTYIEPDHLDIYGEKSAFEEGFRQFLNRVSAGGTVITKPHIAEQLSDNLGHVNVQTYSIEDASADWYADDIQIVEGAFQFTLHCPEGKFESIRLQLPGRHNIENALAAFAAVVSSGQAIERCVKLISGFTGVQRRFEYLGEWKGARVISDYAHHPTEVKAAVKAALELFNNYRVIGIFQPHLYSRTRDFADDFAASLSDLQEVVLLELYPAREIPIPGISSMTIFSNVNVEKKYLASTSEASALLEVLNGDVLLFMGAGDIDNLARSLVKAD